MKTIILNGKTKEYDTLLEKARAIVKNENGKIYICNMNETYMLPGGTVEKDELPINTLKRELEEEMGLKDIVPEELVQIDYYHTQFPKYKSDLYENRLNRVYYYLVNIDSTQLGMSNFTDYEQVQNTKIEEVEISELYNKIKVTNDNKYSEFTNKELKEILDYYIDKCNNDYN